MIETLLGQWLEEVRASHGEPVLDAAKHCGVTGATWLHARTPGCYLKRRAKSAFSQYLDVSEDVIDRLYRMPADPSYQNTNLSGARDRSLSRLGIEIEAACRQNGLRLHEFGPRLGLTGGYVTQLRALGATASQETWEKLAAVLLTTPEQVAAWAQEPAPDVEYPRVTWAGTKYHPTVRIGDRRGVTCDNCPFRAECERDVKERDGFAWCEELIPVDLDPDHVTVSRAAIGESYV